MSQSDDKEDRNDNEQQKLPSGEKDAKPQLGDLSAQLFGGSDVNVDENVVQNVISQNKTLISGLSEQYRRTAGPDEASASGSAGAQSAQGSPAARAGTGAPTGASVQQAGQLGGGANPSAPQGAPSSPPTPSISSPSSSSTSLKALPPPPPGSPRASSTSLAALPPPAWASGPKNTPPPPPPSPVATAPSIHAAPPAAPNPAKPAPVPVRPAAATPPTTPPVANNDLANSPFAAQAAGSSDWDNLFARAESALAGFSKPDASGSTPGSPRDSSTSLTAPPAPSPAPPTPAAPSPASPRESSTSLTALPASPPAQPPPPASPRESSTSLTALPVPPPAPAPLPTAASPSSPPPPVNANPATVVPAPAAEAARPSQNDALPVSQDHSVAIPSPLDTPEPAGASVPSQDLSSEIDEVAGRIIESTAASAQHADPAQEPTRDEAPKFDSTPRAPSRNSNYVDYRLLQEIKEEQEEDEDDSDLVYEPLIKPEVKEKKDEKKVEVIEEPNEMRGMVRRVKRSAAQKNIKPLSTDNKVLKILEKNPLGMTLPEMAGGTRKQSRIKFLRPMLAQAIKEGLVMPVSQRAGHTVYKLVKNITH